MNMLKIALLGVVAVALLAGQSVLASVQLLSDDLYTGTGSHIIYIDGNQPPGTPVDQDKPTTFVHGLFPQNIYNNVAVDSTGLHVLANTQGSVFVVTHSLQVRGGSSSWTTGGFNVQFQVDTPESATLKSDFVPDNAAQILLFDDTTSQVLYNGADGVHFTGILQPGHYTFSGHTYTDLSPFYPNDFGTFSFTAHIANASLSVTPEPTSAAILIVAAGVLGFRRRAKSLN